MNLGRRPFDSNRCIGAVSSTYRLMRLSSQIRLRGEFGIEDQAQIFIIGTQSEFGSAYAGKGEGRNPVSLVENNNISLGEVNDSVCG